MREKEIEHKLVTETNKHGGFAWKFTSPGTAGVPDRIILLPQGKIGFVEVKAPHKKTRAIQTRRLEQLRELGFKVFVLDDAEQIENILLQVTNSDLQC